MPISSVNESNIHRPPINGIVIFRRDLDLEIYYKTSDDKINKIDHDDDIYKIQKVEGFLGFKNWNNQLYPSGEKIEVLRITSQEFFFRIFEDKIIVANGGGKGRSGIDGKSGFSGYSGFSGLNGQAASSGYSGFSGSGISGYSGFSGSGISGYSGFSGSGVSGYSGFSGQDGQVGASGYSGYSGSGVSGYSGFSGQDGQTGISGYSGFSGSGISGYSGFSGSGISGYSGFSGIDGQSGISGYSGFSGSGVSGYSGFSGSGISGYSGFSGSGVSGYSGFSGSGISGYSGFSGSGISGYSGFSGSGISGYSGFSGSGISGYSGFSGSGISGYSGFSGSGVSGYSGFSGSGISGYSGFSGALPTVGATGTILRSNGANWVASTNTYPDTTGVNQILYATGVNAIGSSTSLTFNGTTFQAVNGSQSTKTTAIFQGNDGTLTFASFSNLLLVNANGTAGTSVKLSFSDNTTDSANCCIFGIINDSANHYGTLAFVTRGSNSGGSLVKRVSIPSTGGMVVGAAALATNATDGFLYIPTCAGTPTGVPTTQTGTVAMIYDTTNNKLYIYNGAWKGGTTPGAWT